MSAPFYEVGRYACKITNQALGEAKTGTPQFVLQFTVLGKVDPADPTRYIPAPAQYERTHFRAITDKTIQYFIEDLKTLGFDGDSFKDLDPSTDGFCDLRGKDVDMWCAHENDQDGNLREKWGVARQGGSLEIKPLESKKARELDSLFGKHLKGLKVNVKQGATTTSVPIESVPGWSKGKPPTQAAPFIASDDDVPF